MSEVKNEFLQRSNEDKIRVLLNAVHAITVTMRDPDLGSREVPTLRAGHEVIHRLASQALDMLEGDVNRYPDDVLWDVASDNAGEMFSMERIFKRALEYTKDLA